MLFLDYDIISTGYPGWSLGALKQMSYRERKYWTRMIQWRREKNG